MNRNLFWALNIQEIHSKSFSLTTLHHISDHSSNVMNVCAVCIVDGFRTPRSNNESQMKLKM